MSIASIPSRLRAEARSTNSLDENDSPFSRVITNELQDMKSLRLWRGAVAELLGTALLAFFTIGMGLKKEGQDGPSLLQGAMGTGFFLAGLISALSNVSGAHVNPAVSAGFLVTRQITFVRFLVYSLFQIAGGIAGTRLLKVVFPSEFIGSLGLLTPGPGVSTYQALGVEILITFYLMFVVLALVDPGRDDLAGSVPLMVALTVAGNILCAASISGACMNPARNFGPAVILGEFENIWIYWAGPMVGSVLGSLTYDWFFSTNPFRANSLRQLVGQGSGKDASTGQYKVDETDVDLQFDGDNEVTRSLLKDKLQREQTNGPPREEERREHYDNRRSFNQDKFHVENIGPTRKGGEGDASGESLHLGNLDDSPESKV